MNVPKNGKNFSRRSIQTEHLEKRRKHGKIILQEKK
jgi:hypothetical protein